MYNFIANYQLYMSQRQRLNYVSSKIGSNPTFNISPSQKQSSKSPFSSSKKLPQPNSNNKQKVSYGQLQIVLQNIQQIRKKASQQIKTINIQKDQLRQEIKQKIEKIANLQQKLNKHEQQHKKSLSLIQRQNDIIKDYEIKMINQDKQMRQLQRKIFVLEENVKNSNRQVQSVKKRWKWAFDIISQGQERSQQFIWKVKNQYKNGLWIVLQQNKQLQNTKSKIIDLQTKLNQNKDKNNYTAMIIQKSIVQIDHLKKQNFQLQNQLKNAHQIINKLKDKIHETEQLIQQSKNKQLITQKNLTSQKDNYLLRIKELEEELLNKYKQTKFNQGKTQYEELIDEICDDSQNYSKLTERIRYLQKFRNQYYFNVQKIQYLCKMLDQ